MEDKSVVKFKYGCLLPMFWEGSDTKRLGRKCPCLGSSGTPTAISAQPMGFGDSTTKLKLLLIGTNLTSLQSSKHRVSSRVSF